MEVKNTSHLIDRISEKENKSLDEVKEIVDLVLDNIREIVRENDGIKLLRIGTITKQWKEGSIKEVPVKGQKERIKKEIAPHYNVKFSPSDKLLKD